MGTMVRCAYCGGSGDDRYVRDACKACGGSGQIYIAYNNYVKCNFCVGSGDDRYEKKSSRVRKGAGVTAPGIQIP